MKSLMWFRNDLRIDDNPALRNSCLESNEVHAIYIFSSQQNDLHNEANCKIEFVIENLKSLDQELSKINVPLTIIDSAGFDDNSDIILNLIKERSLKKVFWNNQFGQDEQKRDELVIKIADLNRCCDDMNTAFSCGEGYSYIGMNDEDIIKLEKELEKKND